MPIFEITAPDGKTYEVTAPEGASQDEILRYVQSQVGGAASTAEAPAAPTGEAARPDSIGAQGMFMRGATMGASDYAGAAARWLVDNSVGNLVDISRGKDAAYHPYNDALASMRRDVHAYRDEHPVLATGAEIAGAVAPGFGAGYNALSKGVEAALAKLPFGMPTWARYAAQGGAAGGAASAIGAEGADGGLPALDDIGRQAAAGTLFGAAAGAAAPYVATGVGWLGTRAADAGQAVLDKLPFRQDSVAARKIAENLARDSTDAATLAANRQMLGPGATAADAAGTFDPATGTWLGGRNTRGLADAVVNMPGKSADLAERVLKPRPGQAASELIGAVDQNISGQEFYPRLEQLAAQKSADAAPKYKAAYDAFPTLSSPFLANMAEDPLIQQAAMEGEKAAARAARARGEVPTSATKPMFDFNAAGDPQVSGSWSLEQWDTVKKGIDRMLNNMRDASGRLPKTADVRDLVTFRNSLVDHLDDLTKVDGTSLYTQARQAWAGPSAIEDAMWLGRDFMRGDRELVTARFKKLSPDEQQAFLDGAAREIEDTVEQTGTVPARLKNVLNPESRTRKVLAEVLPKDQFDSFMGTLAGISRKLETAKILGGSQTASRLAGQADMGLDLGGAAMSAMHGNVPGAAAGALKSFANWVKMPSEGARDEMGRLLLDPAAFNDLTAALQRRAQIPRYSGPPVASLLPARVGAMPGLFSTFNTGPSNQTP